MRDNGDRDLIDRSTRFALQIIQLCSALPKTTVAQAPGRQLLRAGTSVGDETSCRLDLLTVFATAESSGIEPVARETFVAVVKAAKRVR
jgi:hypothetical protein